MHGQAAEAFFFQKPGKLPFDPFSVGASGNPHSPPANKTKNNKKIFR
jgi:hypothetical protein